jgi:hypothetical protein
MILPFYFAHLFNLVFAQALHLETVILLIKYKKGGVIGNVVPLEKIEIKYIYKDNSIIKAYTTLK